MKNRVGTGPLKPRKHPKDPYPKDYGKPGATERPRAGADLVQAADRLSDGARVAKQRFSERYPFLSSAPSS